VFQEVLAALDRLLPDGYHRSGWRQTEYHSPRFCSRHLGSLQSRCSTCSGAPLFAGITGLSSEHPVLSSKIANKIQLVRTPASLNGFGQFPASVKY